MPEETRGKKGEIGAQTAWGAPKQNPRSPQKRKKPLGIRSLRTRKEPFLTLGRNPGAEGMAKARKPLQFWIINDTRDTTLENLKYDKKSHSPLKLRPKMLAGDSHLCEVPREPGRPQAERLVLYEANSFTLAIFVHIEWKGPKRLQLELSHDKAHLGQQDDLDKTFSRMSEMRDPPDTETTAVTRCELQDRGEVSTWLFAGAYKLTATLSYHTEHILKVQLEERD